MDFLDWPYWVWAITFLASTLALYWISRPGQKATFDLEQDTQTGKLRAVNLRIAE